MPFTLLHLYRYVTLLLPLYFYFRYVSSTLPPLHMFSRSVTSWFLTFFAFYVHLWRFAKNPHAFAGYVHTLVVLLRAYLDYKMFLGTVRMCKATVNSVCVVHTPPFHACHQSYIWRYAYKETDYCDTPRIQIVCLHTCKHVIAQIQAGSVAIAKVGVVYACDTRAKKIWKNVGM
jgi:hypothetical protein